MTAFILVSGPFTDGRVWHEVAARLRESGCEAHPATLAGMGGRHPAAPGTDLGAHIADVVRLIDRVKAPQVVLVGHDYGIHPVLGAADRRPQRVARIVHLDAGLPQDGEPALALVPDPAVHELLRSGGGRPVPPPAPHEWQRWGSTAGLTGDDLARLSAAAVPQPSATLTRPLRRTGAAAAVPISGVLCTAGGRTIAAVQALVDSGPPQLRALADPRAGFFELATGHWPMLSCPGEVADVLLRAAAGEGHRLTAPQGDPPHLRPFPLDAPERPRVRTGCVDLHLPDADGPRPAVLFVHGGPLPKDTAPTPRDWPLYLGYARCAADLGAVGAVADHRLHGFADYGRAAADVADAVELVRSDPRADPDRIALWFFSGAGLLAADWLAAPPPWLRCMAMTYPVLVPPPGWGGVAPRFRPVAAVGGAGRLPVVLTRAGLESPGFAAGVEAFLTAAEECKAAVELVDVPHGRHGFETQGGTEESRGAVLRALHLVLAHLRG